MLTVYGTEISYFTGKFEGYLRYKEIPYRRRELGPYHYLWKVPRKLGATQFPSVELEDGRWMSDTTPMIAWLDDVYPDPSVFPADALTRFLALLIEDFGDEWLWRPAMHYRWNNAPDAYLASTRLAKGVFDVPLPLSWRRRWLAHRQRSKFVRGDGVDRRTRAHMDRAYLRVLERIEPALRTRPFLLGERPTIADYGLYGPMFRHFSHDPTPARLMRDRAPATWEWVTRMWNARGSELGGRPLAEAFPDDLLPLLDEIGQTHLRALAANAEAHSAGLGHHDFRVQGVLYRGVPTSPYRVWVLEQLRARFRALPDDIRPEVEELLRAHDCWVPIWSSGAIESGHDPDGEAPFCRVNRMVRD
jgi:glutathione S-transferase